MFSYLAIAIVLSLLLIAAWHDVATRTIPDYVALVLVVAGVLARVRDGPLAVAVSIGSAALLFLLLLVVYSRGFVGGGDVKLMAAFAIGLSPFDCYRFVTATAIAGGVVGIAYLIAARCLRKPVQVRRVSLLRRIAAAETWRIRKRGPLPYGVAIAAGGAFVLIHTGSP